MEATVDGQPVAELLVLFTKPEPFLITTTDGMFEIPKLFYWRPNGGDAKFTMGALDGANRIGPDTLQRADLVLSHGLTITTNRRRVFVPYDRLQPTWKP